MSETIETAKAPAPIGPYSQAIVEHGFVFVSGQIPVCPESGRVIEGGIDAQTRQVLKNLTEVLKAAGSGLEKVVKTTVYLTSLKDFPEFNRIYEEFFGKVKPARSTVQVAGLPKEVAVEIEAIAAR